MFYVDIRAGGSKKVNTTYCLFSFQMKILYEHIAFFKGTYEVIISFTGYHRCTSFTI